MPNAKYLASDFQREVLALMAQADRTARDFYVVAPFVLDCLDDATAFKAALRPDLRDAIVERYRKGQLFYVGQLGRHARAYAHAKLIEQHRTLDRETAAMAKQFRDEWATERGRHPDQASKDDQENPSSGVDIILPVSGIRLSYDAFLLSYVD